MFANDSGAIYGLDRATGALQWKYELRVALSAPLSADERHIYIENVEARLIAARLPEMSKPAAATPSPTPSTEGEKKPDEAAPAKDLTAEDVRPLIAFDFDTNLRVESKAVLSRDTVFLAIPNGSYLAVPKIGDASLGNTELYRYAGDSRFSATRGYSDTAAYLPTEDSHFYAVDIDSGKVLWRYIPGRPVIRKPIAVDVNDGGAVEKDLYVTASGKGLARLNRDTGEPVWKIGRDDFAPEADRFIAVNPKFVYVTDGRGRLLVLDRKNGAVLSHYDIRDYAFPISNADTDRIYLAANNGLIVCLHDKDYPQPLGYRRVVAAPVGKSLKERIQEVKDLLAKPITDPGGDMMLFKIYRDKIFQKYGLKIFVSPKAFANAMLPSPDEQTITTPKADNKALGDVLTDVVGQIKGEYTQVEDTLLVSPAKK